MGPPGEGRPPRLPGGPRAVNSNPPPTGAAVDGYNPGMAQPPDPAPRLRWINALGNFLGGIVAFLYFRVVDYAAAGSPRVGLRRWAT